MICCQGDRNVQVSKQYSILFSETIRGVTFKLCIHVSVCLKLSVAVIPVIVIRCIVIVNDIPVSLTYISRFIDLSNFYVVLK